MRVAVIVMVCCLAAAPAAAAEHSIVGVWYEEAKYGGHSVISVADIKADGTYSVTFRHCLMRGEQDTYEIGRWSYANGIMRLDRYGAQGYFTSAYQTDSLDDRTWTYHLVSGPGLSAFGPLRFRDTRVEPGAKVPSCDVSS